MSNIFSFLYGQALVTPPLPTASFAGRTIVITGANTGLGYNAAEHFLRLGVSHLVLGCRNLDKGEAAKQKLCSLPFTQKSAVVAVWELDLCSYTSVVAFAERCNRELPRIDAFLDNAGVLEKDWFVAEGNERTLTVNVVSAFLLAVLLLPKLRESARKYNITPHVVVTGSAIHLFGQPDQLTKPTPGRIFSTLNDRQISEKRMSNRYFLSKLMVTLLVRELATRANGGKKPLVVVNTPNPGWCASELDRQNPASGASNPMFKLIGRTGEVGSRTMVHAATAGKSSNGQYLSECKVQPPSSFVRSKEGATVQADLWEELEEKLDMIHPGIAKML